MGDKARLVPRPLVRWLKHIVHQDEVNGFLWDNRERVGVDWLEACVSYLGLTLNVHGMENLPAKDDGRLYTFVSNHPLGGIDGVALGAIVGRHYDGNFRYLVNDLLMNLPGLAPLCIPINKTGNQSRAFPAMVEAGFKGEQHMMMFPAGLCSRGAHTLRWAELKLFLPFGKRLQTSGHQIQRGHAVPCRRNVQEQAQNL